MHPGHLQTYRSIPKTRTPKGDLREHPSATPCPNLVGSPPLLPSFKEVAPWTPCRSQYLVYRYLLSTHHVLSQ